ncbi:putative clavaminate synthase-like protein [Rosellinia necatrix]|uniref:Putative clavaminate synthase-like protein n=1 Tax=Rosellinia necatrix TaxID=77044 RepID=A0A1W2TFT6_ROSNE|nr:putative clavaminate synthase-like protein [Rosellinia necatrix]
MPHEESASDREFAPERHPAFPEGFPTVSLETISLAKLLADGGDAAEEGRVFEACRGRGFFYLELAGCGPGDVVAAGADRVAAVAEDVFKLPMEEKLSYRLQAGSGSLDGYKIAGETYTDKSGTPDTAEFFNVGKNEMILPADQMKKRWPDIVRNAKPLFQDYIEAAHGIGLSILGILARKMGVDPAEFQNRHRIEEESGDHVRLTRGPPRDNEELPEIQTPSHTDFGTITILMNWLGGLQVWSESARKAQLLNHEPDVPGEWLWVKPKKGCAIINLGDAAVKFTNGVLCAGRHRVIPAPSVQGRFPRFSVVYFVRPENKCIMKQFRGPGIPDGPEEETEINAAEWIKRQATGLGIRFKN